MGVTLVPRGRDELLQILRRAERAVRRSPDDEYGENPCAREILKLIKDTQEMKEEEVEGRV